MPNILLIMTDDLAEWCRETGDRFLETGRIS